MDKPVRQRSWWDGRTDLTWVGTRPEVNGRWDDYDMVQTYAGKHKGCSAVIILGGPSIAGFDPGDEYDIVISCNGAIQVYADVSDYWLCMENFAPEFDMPGFDLPIKGLKVVSFKIWNRFLDKKDILCVTRTRPPEGGVWNPLVYEWGLQNGPVMINRKKHLKVAQPVGTVALQALHWAAFIGATRIKTIGMDLCFRDGVQHGYPYPRTPVENRFWYPSMFTKYRGMDTTWYWIDTAAYLLEVRDLLQHNGIVWEDMSNGLLQAMEAE